MFPNCSSVYSYLAKLRNYSKNYTFQVPWMRLHQYSTKESELFIRQVPKMQLGMSAWSFKQPSPDPVPKALSTCHWTLFCRCRILSLHRYPHCKFRRSGLSTSPFYCLPAFLKEPALMEIFLDRKNLTGRAHGKGNVGQVVFKHFLKVFL